MEEFEPHSRLHRIAPRVAVTIIAGLAGAGAGGVFLAARAPRPAAVSPVRTAALQTQADVRPGFTAPQPVTVKVQRGETLVDAVQRIGISAEEAQQAVETLAQRMDIAHIRAGLALQAAVARPRSDAGPVRLVGLSLRTGPATALTLSRTFDGALRLRELDEKIREETTVADGEIEGSLYESAEKAGASPTITAKVVKLFAHKLDFARDIQPGDEFKLVFHRKVTESGRIVETGDLEFAELHGVKFYRFERGDDVEYFDQSGKNIKGFLLRTPVDATRRITSFFGRRKHPILGYTRAHQGIDFGAAEGTPILAAGDGVVVEERRWGGYGNWLRIRHAGGWDTGYGHISRYAKGVHRGVHVHQGQVIAYVGHTGLATGPHLHYEIWRRGHRVNPLGAKVPQGTVLAGADLRRFRAEKARIDALLARGGDGDELLAAADTTPPAAP
jgi:murein DD-endopeptidase MepM/ murein hydrolase activator NlpD